MAVSRIEDTTPALIGTRWVHQPLEDGYGVEYGHLTHIPIAMRDSMVHTVGAGLRRVAEVLRGKE